MFKQDVSTSNASAARFIGARTLSESNLSLSMTAARTESNESFFPFCSHLLCALISGLAKIQHFNVASGKITVVVSLPSITILFSAAIRLCEYSTNFRTFFICAI
jgi:hypothetical protein